MEIRDVSIKILQTFMIIFITITIIIKIIVITIFIKIIVITIITKIILISNRYGTTLSWFLTNRKTQATSSPPHPPPPPHHHHYHHHHHHHHHSAREVATCDREPGTGSLRLGPLKCPGGLFFDIERQT